jgi:hypothetical protein
MTTELWDFGTELWDFGTELWDFGTAVDSPPPPNRPSGPWDHGR